MDILFWRLLFDFALVVLIWLVQIIIYPGFKYYSSEDLIEWHDRYTRRITFIVIPLMLGQLVLSTLILFYQPTAYSIGTMALLFTIWLLTFLFFVPQHRDISKGRISVGKLDLLIKTNWWRTAFWTIIFVWTLVTVSIDYPIE